LRDARRPDGNGVAASIRAAGGECTSGTAAHFDEAGADFETAWRVFLAKRAQADFQAWRGQPDWTERKCAAWAAGERALVIFPRKNGQG
jgi:hypothetical protein